MTSASTSILSDRNIIQFTQEPIVDEIFCICNNKTNKSPMLECCYCRSWYHRKCTKISFADFKLLANSSNLWLCSNCFSILKTSNYNSTIFEPQRIPCFHCPERTFKDQNRLQIHMNRFHKNMITPEVVNSTSIAELLMLSKINISTLRRIPKATRFLAADKLCSVIDNALSTKTVFSFENLLLFAYKAFSISKMKNISLTNKVKENLKTFSLEFENKLNKRRGTMSLAKRVEAKVADFDIKGAVKLLCSDDSLAPCDKITAELLQKKHPLPSRELFYEDTFSPEDSFLLVSEADVRATINSFPAGSAPGLDGLRPQHLKDLVSLSAGEAGKRVLRAITKLCNFMLSGQLPEDICRLFYGASLCALRKKEGGIRPIAAGNCFRRLTAKLACLHSRSIIHAYLSPHEVRVATKQGCEAGIHALRTYVNNPENIEKVVLKLDFKNAFNSVERDCILKAVKGTKPPCKFMRETLLGSSGNLTRKSSFRRY